MAVTSTQNSSTRFYLAGIHETLLNWKKIRALVQILEQDIQGSIENWETFKLNIVPLCTSGNIAFMGSASKADNVPDETVTRPVPLVQPADVFNLYNTALSKGFQLNPTKVWIPTNEDPNIYAEELQQALGNWYCVADFYIQICDLLYLIGNIKSFCALHKAIDNIPDVYHTGAGSGISRITRTPGQLIQMFPNTNAYISSILDWTHLDTKRIYDVLDDEFFYWVSRMEIEYIQEDPLLDFTIGASSSNVFNIMKRAYDEDTGEYLGLVPFSSPGNDDENRIFVFDVADQERTQENDIFIGLNISSYTTPDGQRTEFKLSENDPHWVWEIDYPNRFGFMIIDPTTDPEHPISPIHWLPESFLNVGLYLRVLRDDR